MEIKEIESVDSVSIKLIVEEDGEMQGWCYIYVLKNDLHDKPFALLENVYIDEKHRSRGLGKQLVGRAVEVAEAKGCYKIIGTSRHEKPGVHRFYENLGFRNHGLEFRIDFN